MDDASPRNGSAEATGCEPPPPLLGALGHAQTAGGNAAASADGRMHSFAHTRSIQSTSYGASSSSSRDSLGYPSMPRVRSPVSELDTPLVLGTHVATRMRVFAIPKTSWIQHINEPQGTVPFLGDTKCLRVYVRGLLCRAFIEQVATGIPEALCKPTQTYTMSAL